MKIRDQVSRANEAVIAIRELKTSIAKEKLSAANKIFIEKLSAIEENLYQVKNQSAQDPLNFPIKVNNRLAALESSVETGDNKPTDAAYTVFNVLSEELQAYLNDLQSLLKKRNINKTF